MKAAAKTPLPVGERETPRSGEGEGTSSVSHALTLALRACPSPLQGEGR
jgi:hypothetical protein